MSMAQEGVGKGGQEVVVRVKRGTPKEEVIGNILEGWQFRYCSLSQCITSL